MKQTFGHFTFCISTQRRNFNPCLSIWQLIKKDPDLGGINTTFNPHHHHIPFNFIFFEYHPMFFANNSDGAAHTIPIRFIIGLGDGLVPGLLPKPWSMSPKWFCRPRRYYPPRWFKRSQEEHKKTLHIKIRKWKPFSLDYPKPHLLILLLSTGLEFFIFTLKAQPIVNGSFLIQIGPAGLFWANSSFCNLISCNHTLQAVFGLGQMFIGSLASALIFFKKSSNWFL